MNNDDSKDSDNSITTIISFTEFLAPYETNPSRMRQSLATISAKILFKVNNNNRDTRNGCEIYLEITIKKAERRE